MFDDMPSRFRAAEIAQAEHEATCTANPCERCKRFVCRIAGCMTPTHGPLVRCLGCRDKEWRETWRARCEQQIPAGFREARFGAVWLESLLGAKVVAEAHAALDAVRVAAVGDPGAGKTSLIAAMLAASDFAKASRGEGRAMWVSAHQLAKARALHPLGDGEAPFIASALSANLLVVDEVGGEDQRYASAVTEVLYERHAEARPTWVTTGVGPKEIANRYGGGIARRIFEDAKVFTLKPRTGKP